MSEPERFGFGTFLVICIQECQEHHLDARRCLSSVDTSRTRKFGFGACLDQIEQETLTPRHPPKIMLAGHNPALKVVTIY
jgi:hypothetical protein